MDQQQQHHENNDRTREREGSDGAPPARGLGDANDLSSEIDRILNRAMSDDAEQFLRHSRQTGGQ